MLKCPVCDTELERLDTRSEPEGIREDARCSGCLVHYAVTKAGLVSIGPSPRVRIYEIVGDGYTMKVGVDEANGTGFLDSDLRGLADDDDQFEEGGIDAIEGVVLGHACAGIDVSSAAYVAGLDTAVNTLFS